MSIFAICLIAGLFVFGILFAWAIVAGGSK